MAIIKKKIWPSYFALILKGLKKYEVRLGNFNVQPGDTLILQEWDPDTRKYSGREMRKNVTLVLKTKDLEFWPPEETEKYGYQIISFE
jgi:hypothetical protein